MPRSCIWITKTPEQMERENREWRARGGGKGLAAQSSVPGPEIDDDPDPFPCAKCDRGFTSQRGLSRHITAVHPQEDPALE